MVFKSIYIFHFLGPISLHFLKFCNNNGIFTVITSRSFSCLSSFAYIASCAWNVYTANPGKVAKFDLSSRSSSCVTLWSISVPFSPILRHFIFTSIRSFPIVRFCVCVYCLSALKTENLLKEGIILYS